MFCHKCGTELFESNFCPNCGQKIIKTRTIDRDLERKETNAKNEKIELENYSDVTGKNECKDEIALTVSEVVTIKEKLLTILSGTIRVVVLFICAAGVIVSIAGFLAEAYLAASCLLGSMIFFWRFGSIVRTPKKALKGLATSVGLFILFIVWLAMI